jgi:hypothetical protein
VRRGEVLLDLAALFGPDARDQLAEQVSARNRRRAEFDGLSVFDPGDPFALVGAPEFSVGNDQDGEEKEKRSDESPRTLSSHHDHGLSRRSASSAQTGQSFTTAR